jgi:hypothetical protein
MTRPAHTHNAGERLIAPRGTGRAAGEVGRGSRPPGNRSVARRPRCGDGRLALRRHTLREQPVAAGDRFTARHRRAPGGVPGAGRGHRPDRPARQDTASIGPDLTLSGPPSHPFWNAMNLLSVGASLADHTTGRQRESLNPRERRVDFAANTVLYRGLGRRAGQPLSHPADDQPKLSSTTRISAARLCRRR